jgi:hypothetical protein
VYNHSGRFGAAEPELKLGMSPAKTPRPQRSKNNNKQFFKIIYLFPPKLGVLCALAGVKSFDRKFHVEQ